MNADPDPATQINADPDTDPDLKPCFKCQKTFLLNLPDGSFHITLHILCLANCDGLVAVGICLFAVCKKDVQVFLFSESDVDRGWTRKYVVCEQGRSRRERRSTAGTTKRFADCVVPVTSPRSAAKLKKQPPVKRNAVGETPLHQAAKRGDAARVQQLLRQGADPNVTDHAG